MSESKAIAAGDPSGVTPWGTAWRAEGNGEPIVLIHGVGMNQSVWSPQVADLRKDFKPIVYDMIGHGASRYDPATRDIGDYGNQLVELLNTLGISKAHIVGHSMGALVAIEMAVAHSSRCKSVMALNGVYCRTAEQRQSVQDRANDLAQKGKPDSVKDTISRWFGEPVPPRDVPAANLCTRLLTHVPLNGYARAYEIFSNSDERHLGKLGTIKVPTMLVTGELDPNSSPAMSAAMHAEIAGSEIRILPNQRHMMSLVEVDTVNELIRNFVKSHH